MKNKTNQINVINENWTVLVTQNVYIIEPCYTAIHGEKCGYSVQSPPMPLFIYMK